MAFLFTKDTVNDFLQNGPHQNQVNDIVSGLKTKTQNILELVEILGPVLCSKENDVRLIGTKFFVDILHGLSSADLNQKEVEVIWNFFIDRLNDHHSIIPSVLSGGLILLRNHVRLEKCLAGFCTKMFRCIVCQTQKREDRESIYEILKISSESKSEEFKKMGADWIYGVINAIEGERDPRNLLLIFKFMPQLIQNYPLYHLTEDTFEVFAVYFPVDFTQSDSSAISRDLLAEQLEKCLCASPDFLDGCVELVLEKMTSDLKTAKTDSFKLLINLSKRFSNGKMAKHFKSLWDAMKEDLLTMSDQNKEIKTLALTALQNLMINISEDNQTFTDSVNMVLATTMVSLSDVDSKLFAPNFDIICSCLGGNEKLALYIFPKLLPLLITSFKSVDIERKVKILESIQRICSDAESLNIVEKLTSDDNLLQKEVIDILLHENNPTILNITLQITQKIVKLINSEKRLTIYSKLVALTRDSNNTEIINHISNTIISFSENFHNEVREFVICDLKEQTTSEVNIRPIKILINLMFVPNFKGDIDQFLLQFILDAEKNEPLRIVAVTYLADTIIQNNEFFSNAKPDFIVKLTTFIKGYSQQTPSFLIHYTQLLKFLVKYSDVETQRTIVLHLITQLDPQLKNNLYILSGLLGHLSPAVALNGNFQELSQKLVQISISTNDKDCQTLSNHLLCSLFNKCPNDDKHKLLTLKILEILKLEVLCKKIQGIETFAWVSKGLLKRGCDDLSLIIDPLIELLNESATSSLAVLTFEIVTNETPELHLPFEKYLFKQKLFSYVMKKIDCKSSNLSDDHVTTFILVMNIMPISVLKINIQNIGAIIIKALNLTDHRCVLACLNILNKFIEEQHTYFSTYISLIIEQLLILTKHTFPMKIRLEALSCLKNLASYPTFLLLPQKDQIIYGIVHTLDDPKRLVRNSARITRMKWCVIGTEED